MSHLLQMRGLKLLTPNLITSAIRSHLLQMRGLKLLTPNLITSAIRSHLLQMRGLKPNEEQQHEI